MNHHAEEEEEEEEEEVVGVVVVVVGMIWGKKGTVTAVLWFAGGFY